VEVEVSVGVGEGIRVAVKVEVIEGEGVACGVSVKRGVVVTSTPIEVGVIPGAGGLTIRQATINGRIIANQKRPEKVNPLP